MSNSFKNPLIPLIDNPVNIDRPIQELQIELSSMGWLEKSFGRAYNSYRIDENKKKISHPEVWQGLGKDLLNVMPNDNLKSQSFFRVHEPIRCMEFNPDGYSIMAATVSIIFWFNLKEVDDSIDYRYIEILKGRAQRKITNAIFSPQSDIKILRIWDTAEQVFSGYDLSQHPAEQLTHPFGGFRFECDLSYIEDCPDSLYNDTDNPELLTDNGYLEL